MDYCKSRNLAWQILLDNKIDRLPVDVFKICENENIKLLTYSNSRFLIEDLNLQEHTVNNDAFSFDRVIVYDDTRPLSRQRFSIAHELGHIFMHIVGGPTVFNRENEVTNDPTEAEANIFASRLLAPLCVLQFMDVNSAEEVAELCDIGISSALIRFSRLCKMRKRSANMRREGRHGSFLTSGLERKVYENFREYIEEYKREKEKLFEKLSDNKPE